MRRSLRLLLEGEHDIEVLAEADNLAEATRQVLDRRPQVLVLSSRLVGGSGAAAIETLSKQSPATQIVVVTMEDSPDLARRVLGAGALGFVLKDTADVELPPAIRQAARGALYTSPRLTEGNGTRRRHLGA